MSSVDVIIPCYGYGSYLPFCVNSVLSQASVDVRVLIIDDASPDDTAETADALVRADPRVHFRRHAENRGHIATYNEGLEWISAPYALLLSADDYLLPGALSRAVRLMSDFPDVVMTYGIGVELYSEDPAPSTVHDTAETAFRILSGDDFIAACGARNPVVTASAIVRTKVQKCVGGYRPELPHAGDMEMWFRFAAHGKIGEILVPQAVYRRHRINMSHAFNGRMGDVQQRRRALDVFFESYKATSPRSLELKRAAMRHLAHDAVMFASQAYDRGDDASCATLLDTALDISPTAKVSAQWRRLAWKRRLGHGNWSAIRPWLKRARTVRQRVLDQFSQGGPHERSMTNDCGRPG